MKVYVLTFIFVSYPGIESRLDYFVDIGIETLWLSPIYKSPMADFGYDISDFRDIDPIFGTLEDFNDLVAAMHSRGMNINKKRKRALTLFDSSPPSKLINHKSK